MNGIAIVMLMAATSTASTAGGAWDLACFACAAWEGEPTDPLCEQLACASLDVALSAGTPASAREQGASVGAPGSSEVASTSVPRATDGNADHEVAVGTGGPSETPWDWWEDRSSEFEEWDAREVPW